MERARILRFLRFAVTVLSLTACVLLIALWVRSYWYKDYLLRINGSSAGAIGSVYGILFFEWQNYRAPVPSWELRHGIPANPRHLQWFYWDNGNSSTALKVPFWAIVLPLGMLAAIPWIHWSKRFSLRTLLIATTLVAVGLAAIVYASR